MDVQLNFRETAETLGLDALRLTKLARRLNFVPNDKVIPETEVHRIEHECPPEERYGAVLRWVLDLDRART